jgi:hypothetical protein
MAIWTEAQEPGDSVRILMLERRGTLGCVRIQDFKGKAGRQRYRVSAFLPTPADPLADETVFWTVNNFAADELFDKLVGEAYEAEWQNRAEPEVEPRGDSVTIDWSTGEAI